MKSIVTAALALTITLTFTQKAAAEKPPEKAAVGTFTDTRDKKKYKTVKIGEQVWMAENLNYEAAGSKCYGEKGKVYNSKTEKSDITLSKAEIQANCDKYGSMYNWETAMKACPKGWRLPSEVDWSDLMQFVNPDCSVIGDCADAGAELKAASGWNENGNGTDKHGFAALPGGVGLSDGNFRDVGNGGLWWSSSDDAKKASRISIDIGGPNVHRNSSDKNLLFSIRCLQGAPIQTEKGSFTDSRNNKTYKTVKIGKQTWMAENLNIKTGASWCYGNSEANCQKYGRLYDQETAKEACPSGWHLPSRDEWREFVDSASLRIKPGDGCYAGTVWTGGRKLKTKSSWKKLYEGSVSNGTDDYGFSALPGGSRCADGNIMQGDCSEWMEDIGTSGKWWTPDIDEEGGASSFEITEDEVSLCTDMGRIGSGRGYSVRCVKDAK